MLAHLVTLTSIDPTGTGVASFEGDLPGGPPLATPTGFVKWHGGQCQNTTHAVPLSDCLTLIDSVSDDFTNGTSDTYLCSPSTPGTPAVKTVNNCSLTLVADKPNE
jgi:hypothetical protein